MRRFEPIGSAGTRALRPRRLRRVAIAILVIGGSLLGAAPRAGATPLVCVTVYYTTFGGPRHYLADDECFVATGWPEFTGVGPQCGPVPALVNACIEVTVAGP